MDSYRPWGRLQWLLTRCAATGKWSLLGCLGTEERSLAAWEALKSTDLQLVRLVRIVDRPSRHTPLAERRLDERRDRFVAQGGDPSSIIPHDLLAPHYEIVRIVQEFLASASPNVVLDVTSMPKRYFFPILRWLIQHAPTINNLVVAYSVPVIYTKEPLAENVNDWAHLPLFSGRYTRTSPQLLIVSIGFEPLGLLDQVEHGEHGLSIKLLIPFPSSPLVFKRSWALRGG